MNQGRLSTEFRDRTKQFAADTIQLFIKLPKTREEIRVPGQTIAVVGNLGGGTNPVSVARQVR